ncbi:MAG: ATP-binding protein [Myxococcota bacterium]
MAPSQDLERTDGRPRYEYALARCSALLLRRGGIKAAPVVLSEALEPLRLATDADRVYLFQHYEDEELGLCTRRKVEVLRPGTHSASDMAPDHFPYQPDFSRWIDLFLGGKPVHGPVEDFPEAERIRLRAHGVQSILILPVWVMDECWGILGFDDMSGPRSWTETDIRLLETAAQVIGAFLERGLSQERLQAAQAQLVQTEKMATIGALVAGVAHEINTPLGAISSMQDTLFRGLEKLRSKVDDQEPEVQKALRVVDDAHKVIQNGTKRVLEIVRRLKDFARFDEGELVQVDLREELGDTLGIAHHELKHGVKVKLELEALPWIEGHPNQLNQVFLNLIVNAKQAMKGRGELRIVGRVAEEDAVRLSFADTGPGVPEDRVETIFEPGFTTKSKGVGLGLGLAICKQIVDKHNGRIWVENLPEGGAKFVVELPVRQPEVSTD